MKGYSVREHHMVLVDDDDEDDELPQSVKYTTIVQAESFVPDDFFSPSELK